MSETVGLLRLTEQAKVRSLVAAWEVCLMTSAPPVRSAPWQVVREQPVVWRAPPGLFRSTVPKRIGWISVLKTPRLKLSAEGHVLLLPPPGAFAFAAWI